MVIMLCLLLLAAQVHLNHAGQEKEYVFTVGGLFGAHDALEQSTFSVAVDHVNKMDFPFKLSPMAHVVSPTDALESTNLVCDTFFLKGIAIFGPNAQPASGQVQSLCDMKEIPNFLLTSLPQGSNTGYTVSLYPLQRAVGKALGDFVKTLAWDSFVVLYQTDEGLVQVQDLLKMTNGVDNKNDPRIKLRRIPVGEDYRRLLKEIQEVLTEDHIVVQADIRTSRKFLQQASAMKMISKPYHYIFTNLDTHTLDLETYKAEGCNISAIRMVVDNNMTKALIDDLTKTIGRKSMPTVGIQTSAALVYDSVMFFAKTLKIWYKQLNPMQLSCHMQDSWRDGSSFVNSMKMMKFNGTTGYLALDSYGTRSGVELQIVEMGRKTGFQQVGLWTEAGVLKITKSHSEKILAKYKYLRNHTLIVTMKLEEPFVMLKEKEERLTGNDRYEGYCVDLLEEISNIVNFSYEIRLVKDKTYGAKDENDRWNGLVGELLRGEADIAVASLTISYSRSSVIDFTVPFMHLGISILFKKPEKTAPDLFTFLSPLSLDVWVYMLSAYVGVSLTLWILARFSPYEWYNPHPCKEDAEIVENQFSLINSLWFTVGSLMQQGCEISPKAGSTRIVAGTWWFFTLILISSYTANLAAFLTVERMVSPIESADDLAKQNKIRYGSLNSGSTKQFFQESKIDTYARMWAFMSSVQPTPFVNSSAEGIQRVKQSSYAYLMESSMLEYYVERDCDLVQVGGLLDSKGYGIGLPKGSHLRDPISAAILMLQEKTKLTSLKEKWWKQKRGGGNCKKDDTKKAASALDLANVGGVFVFLVIGLCLAFFTALAEFIYKTGQRRALRNTSVCREMLNELRFAFQCEDTRTEPNEELKTKMLQVKR